MRSTTIVLLSMSLGLLMAQIVMAFVLGLPQELLRPVVQWLRTPYDNWKHQRWLSERDAEWARLHELSRQSVLRKYGVDIDAEDNH